MLYKFYDFIVFITNQSKLVSVVEVTNIRTYSRKTNKLRNIYTIEYLHQEIENLLFQS